MSPEREIPIATKWLKESAGDTENNYIDSVFLIACPNGKGTGFLYKSEYIITNWHVVEDCKPDQIIAISSKGEELEFKDIIVDKNRDLALLSLKKPLEGKGFEIDLKSEIKPGIQIGTWGYPLAYNGPAPLLSVGYISGFRDHKEKEDSPIVKHLVVNGAFNPGNSGGPLFISNSNKIIGVVVSKHAPITSFLLSALKALATNESGVVFTCTDQEGNKKDFVESQIVAEFLVHFRKLTQVMIGEAIDRSELVAFLKENNVE